ncbi:MAG TPA: hypothetical protein ENI64_09460 [Gammaproteobacteria bacterium]|nr:hypothetical protein [Gammaproteobacteria bacterium]
MNNKTTHPKKNISRQDSTPTGKDLPLFTYLVNYINTPGSARLIRFSRHDTQCSNLDLHLMVDPSNRHVIKVVDSDKKDVIREIPYSDLLHIMQVTPSIMGLQEKGSKCISGTEVALSMCSVLEVI